MGGMVQSEGYGTTGAYGTVRGMWYRGLLGDMVQSEGYGTTGAYGQSEGSCTEGYGTTRGIWYSQRNMV